MGAGQGAGRLSFSKSHLAQKTISTAVLTKASSTGEGRAPNFSEMARVVHRITSGVKRQLDRGPHGFGQSIMQATRGSTMSRTERKRNRRKAAWCVEQLDDRTLLTVAVLAPVVPMAPVAAAPAAAASPGEGVLVSRFEADIQRLDRQFISGASHLNNLLTNRLAQLQRTLAADVNRANLKVQNVANNTGTAGAINLGSINSTVNASLGRLIATVNARKTSWSANSRISSPLSRIDLQTRLPCFRNL